MTSRRCPCAAKSPVFQHLGFIICGHRQVPLMTMTQQILSGNFSNFGQVARRGSSAFAFDVAVRTHRKIARMVLLGFMVDLRCFCGQAASNIPARTIGDTCPGGKSVRTGRSALLRIPLPPGPGRTEGPHCQRIGGLPVAGRGRGAGIAGREGPGVLVAYPGAIERSGRRGRGSGIVDVAPGACRVGRPGRGGKRGTPNRAPRTFPPASTWRAVQGKPVKVDYPDSDPACSVSRWFR